MPPNETEVSYRHGGETLLPLALPRSGSRFAPAFRWYVAEENRQHAITRLRSRETFKFARLLHSRNCIDKQAWETAEMKSNSPDTEMHSLIRDWSSSVRTLDLRIKEGDDPFMRSQRAKLLQLRAALTESMTAVTKGCPLNDNETSPLGTHPADAGSAVYDRDFALSQLTHEKDALHEIDQALRRIDLGTYGICEMSGRPIPRARLGAIPAARFTLECQSQLEKEKRTLLILQRGTRFALIDTEAEQERREEQELPDNDDN